MLRLRPLFTLFHPPPPPLSRLSHPVSCRLHTSAHTSALVSPAWLHARLTQAIILDATWYKPPPPRDPDADFLAEHIPGAQRFDIDAPDLCDTTSALPHMLPPPATFSRALSAFGVRADTPVVVYARRGFVASARAWWMFRASGFRGDVHVLQGGLDAWKAAGYVTESGAGKTRAGGGAEEGLGIREWHLVRSMAEVVEQVGEGGEGVIVDARGRGRFQGRDKEPREGLRGGHMPGAVCVPAGECVDEEGKMKAVEELTTVFEEAGVEVDKLRDKQVTLTCGSGVTAGVLCLALYELGMEAAAVYDGSWSEYGMYAENPIAKEG